MIIEPPPVCAAAPHPVHDVVQAAYLTLAPEGLRLELSIAAGHDVAGPLLVLLDPDGDGSVSVAEADVFGRQVLSQATLTIDGVALAWTSETVATPDLETFEAEGSPVIVKALAQTTLAPGPHRLTFRNAFSPAESLWSADIFTTAPAAGPRYVIEDQTRSADGQELTVAFSVK